MLTVATGICQSLALTLLVGLVSPKHTSDFSGTLSFFFCVQGQTRFFKHQSLGPWCEDIFNKCLKLERVQAWREDSLVPRPDHGPDYVGSLQLELLLSLSPCANTHFCDYRRGSFTGL